MYRILRPIVRLALFFYLKKISVYFDKDSRFAIPKIIASNHPNSFFDAIIIAVFYPKPIYFLARGDAFKKGFITKILNLLHLIPIYRISEGRSHLSKNNDTFKTCLSLLKKGETILIFSEGICVNEWKLRSLKKGTARLALMAIHNKIENLVIQPSNLNYSSFHHVPKNILVNFNKEFQANSIPYSKEIEFYTQFNTILKSRIEENLIHDAKVLQLEHNKKNTIKKITISIPAFLGWVTHKWFYNCIKKWVTKKTKNSVFYDSVLFGCLLITYPLFILLISIIIGVFFGFYAFLISFIIFPLLAYSYKSYKTISPY